MAVTLGKRLSELRKEKGITQEKLAELCGVSSQAVSKWENDLSAPDIMLLPQIADLLGITVDELLTGEKQVQTLILPPEKRKSADEMLLKIRVIADDNTNVKVNLPLSLVKVGLEMGLTMDFIPNNASQKFDFSTIDFDKIFSLVNAGVMGKLVEVEADEVKVEIFVE